MLSVKARLQNMLDVSRQLTECVRRNQLTEADIMSDVDVQWMVSTPITYLSEQAARMLADHREDADLIPVLEGILGRLDPDK